jgi:hypothetical protein
VVDDGTAAPSSPLKELTKTVPVAKTVPARTHASTVKNDVSDFCIRVEKKLNTIFIAEVIEARTLSGGELLVLSLELIFHQH